jgi:hypothetical protein
VQRGGPRPVESLRRGRGRRRHYAAHIFCTFAFDTLMPAAELTVSSEGD